MYLFTNNHLVDSLLDKWEFEKAFELISEECDEFFIGHTIFGVTKYFKVVALEDADVDENESADENDLLSMEAIEWLSSIGYDTLSHDDRMAVIKAAKIAYPN